MEYAPTNRLAIEGISEDQTSGCGTNRPGLAELTLAVKTGKIDAILVWNIDRLFSSIPELMQYLELLKEHNVKIITVFDGVVDLELLLCTRNLLMAKAAMIS